MCQFKKTNRRRGHRSWLGREWKFVEIRFNRRLFDGKSAAYSRETEIDRRRRRRQIQLVYTDRTEQRTNSLQFSASKSTARGRGFGGVEPLQNFSTLVCVLHLQPLAQRSMKPTLRCRFLTTDTFLAIKMHKPCPAAVGWGHPLPSPYSRRALRPLDPLHVIFG